MSDIFSFSRFVKLLVKQWQDNSKRYILSLVVAAGLIAAIMALVIIVPGGRPKLETQAQVIIYAITLFGLGCVFSGSYFASLGETPKGIAFLQLPASHLEKILVAFFYNVIFFMVAFHLIFFALDALMVGIDNRLGKQAASESGQGAAWRDTELIGWSFMIESMMPFLFLVIQSLFLLGSIFYSQNVLLKTTLSVLVLFTAGSFVIFNLMELVVPDNWFAQGIGTWLRFEEGEPVGRVQLGPWYETALRWLFFAGVPVTTWYITYVRLQEKQI